MGILLSLISIILLLVGGGGCALLLLPRREPVQPVELFALAVALGSLVVAATSFACGFLVSGFGLQLVVGLICLGLAALSTRFGAPVRVGLPALRGWVLPMLVFVIGLGVVVWLGGLWALGWDSLVDWEFKARAAALNGGVVPRAYFVDPGTQWSHPEYPLLLPLTEAWLFDWAGQADERLVRELFGLFDAALLATVYVLGTRLGGNRWNGTLGMLLLLFVPQLIVGFGSTTTAWADFLVAWLYLMAGGYLVQAVVRKTPDLFCLVGVLCAAMVWTKQEGAFLWASLVLATAIFSPASRIRATAVVAVPALAVGVGWHLFVEILGVPPSFDFLPFTPSMLLAHLDRVPEIIAATAGKMADGGSWSLLWIGLIVSLVLPNRWQRRQQLLLGVLVLAPLAPDMLIFVFSAWTPYLAHVDSAMQRLIEEVAALAVLAIASAAPCPHVPEALRPLTSSMPPFSLRSLSGVRRRDATGEQTLR